MICQICHKEIDFLDTAEYLWDRRCVCKKCAAEYRAKGVEECGAFLRVKEMEIEEARWKGAGLGDYYCSVCCTQVSGRPKECPCCHRKMSNPVEPEEVFSV